MNEDINLILKNVRKIKPLILNITNYVTMDFVANGLLAIGASPIMSLCQEETNDLLKLARAVVINLGTLSDDFLNYCEHVCEIANQANVPIILDPVGAGASQFRTSACEKILDKYTIAMIRGNASEILGLCNREFTTHGVDSNAKTETAFHAGSILSKKYNAVVVISGETDIIIDHDQFSFCKHGCDLLPQITGSGCLLTAVLAAFLAIEKNRFHAAKTGVYFYALSGERVAKQAYGPGSFKMLFLDALSCFSMEK